MSQIDGDNNTDSIRTGAPDPAPTPRTDAVAKNVGKLAALWKDGTIHAAEFCEKTNAALDEIRTLERELTSAHAALAAKDAEIENLVWNLAGCDTLAMGYAKPGEFSKELARPALHSVSKLRAERDALRAEVERLKRRDSFDLQAINKIVADQTANLRAQLAAAKEDKERLELLAVNAAEVRVEWDDGEGPIPPEFSIVAKGTGVIGRGPTLRAAIDAARAGEGKP